MKRLATGAPVFRNPQMTSTMRDLTATICLTLALLLGNAGVSWSADFQKGVAAYNSGDFATALREFRALAEQGDALAQSSLGAMYAKGQGVTQDYKEAVKWYRKAAERGFAGAQLNLGVRYAKGEGVIQDLVYAHMWFNIAASAGQTIATKNRDKAAKQMTPSQIAEAQKLARECVRKNYKRC